MKTTNAAIEATTSEHIYIATRVRTEVWEERTELDTSTHKCADMAAVTQILVHNSEGLYVVANLATGEKRTYESAEFRNWLATQTMDAMVDYRISFTVVWDRASLHGRGKITHEVYFTRAKRSDADEKHTADGAQTVENVPQVS